MHLLLAPLPFAKLDRQPIKQMFVLGIFTLHPHVLGRLHDPGAEEVLPHPVDLHAGRQRVFWKEEPLGQTEPVGRAPGR